MPRLLIAVAVTSLFFVGSAARASLVIVNNNNLDSAVTSESTPSSQTEGAKNGANENNGGGTTISSTDPGTQGYWQGFKTGPSGSINQLTLDLAVLASAPGVNENITGADTATFYLYSYPNALITSGRQIGPAIATVSAAQIESGSLAGYSANNTSDIYQYNLIISPSTYALAANTPYAIVMMTSSGSQDVGWAESNTEANGDMGEFENVNSGGNNGGAFGQMELTVIPEPSTLVAGLFCLGWGFSTQGRRLLQRRIP